jgi:tRNA nucleotidyltransferase (CCA-adding enzyme)
MKRGAAVSRAEDRLRQRFLRPIFAPDFCAHAGGEGQPYPKAALLEIALKARADIAEDDSPEARQGAGAEAIARAFRSERWASEVA